MFEGALSLVAYVKIFVAMIVVVNPFGIMPVFVAMTSSHSDGERMRIARIAAQTVAVVLLISAIFGERVLELFGISIASFKVGGAILIMLNAMAMMQAMPARDKQTPEEAEEAEDKASIAVVPLGIPLLAGPGAMSTIVIYASEKKVVWHLLAVCATAIGVDRVAHCHSRRSAHEHHHTQRCYAHYGFAARCVGSRDFCRRNR